MLIFVFDTPQECNKFITLYEAYGKLVYYTIKRFVSNEYTIEDISQNIYIIIAEHLDNIDMKDSKKTRNYIITITRNYCKNFLRDNNKQEASLENMPYLYTEYDYILNDIINREQIHYLAKEINSMNDIYKSVLELKYINNFNNDEIAAFLKIKKKTVEMRLYRATIILRERLAKRLNE